MKPYIQIILSTWLVCLAILPVFHHEHHHEISSKRLSFHDQNCEDPDHHFELEDCVYCKNTKENKNWAFHVQSSFKSQNSTYFKSFNQLLNPTSKKESSLTRAPPIVV